MSRFQMFELLLLGWYLIVAPPRDPGRHSADFSALLPDWVRLRLFDDVSQCLAMLRDCERKPPESLTLMLNGIKNARAAMDAAPCVATSDPRLK
jgi:hypothetical protein